MKNLLIAVFTLLYLQQAQTQTPLYMLFNSGCMDQLEYKISTTGAMYSAFGIHAGNNQQYLLRTGEATLTSKTLPAGTETCGALTLGEQLLQNVNNELRPVYILIPNATGYSMLPVTVVTQFKRSGSYIFVNSAKYSFAIDTSSLTYDQNLASAGSQTKVFFTGMDNSVCKERYHYRVVPVLKSEAEYTADLEYIPGVGITKMRFGQTGTNQEIQSLERINGVPLITHVSQLCGTKKTDPTPASTAVATTTPVQPVEDPKKAKMEATKDLNSQPVATISNPYAIDPVYKPLTDCPEKPGYGYHLVQPGESLNAISRTYGVSSKQLIGWNKLKDPDHIEPCEKIWLIDPPKQAEPVKASQTISKSPKVDPGLRVVSQAPLWDLQPGQIGPPSPTTYGFTSKSPVETTPATPKYHTVEKGENVSQLSRKYGFTETQFRELNKLPAKGDVVIFPGQKLLVENPTATPTVTAKTPATPPPAAKVVTPTSPVVETVPKTQEVAAPPVVVAKPTETVVVKPTPQVQEVFSEQVVTAPVTPNLFTPTPTTSAPAATQPKTETVREPSYIQEYVVRDGETIESVAKKFGITQKELSDINSKKSDETLVAGTRLMIPRY